MEGKDALYAKILEANLFGQGTGEAIFAIDPNLSEVILFKSLNIEKTDYQDFANELKELVSWVATWTEKIKTTESSSNKKPKITSKSKNIIFKRDFIRV